MATDYESDYVIIYYVYLVSSIEENLGHRIGDQVWQSSLPEQGRDGNEVATSWLRDDCEMTARWL